MVNLLFLYTVVCSVYVYFFEYKRKKRWLAQWLIVLFFPIFGFFLVYLMNKEKSSKKDSLPKRIIVLSEKSTDKDVSIFKGDVEKERNVIPIGDALILNEDKVKRRLLLDLLKKDSLQNIEALKFALENEDSETSHYAASAIMEIKRKLLNSIQSLEVEVDENPNDVKVLKSYRDVMKQYINSGFLDEKTMRRNMYTYSNLLEKLIELIPSEDENYVEKISGDLSLSELANARHYCDLFLRLHPLNEQAYFLDMQIHFLLKNKEEFNHSLNRLKNSSVRLSPEGLNKLRFWLQGDKNEL